MLVPRQSLRAARPRAARAGSQSPAARHAETAGSHPRVPSHQHGALTYPGTHTGSSLETRSRHPVPAASSITRSTRWDKNAYATAPPPATAPNPNTPFIGLLERRTQAHTHVHTYTLPQRRAKAPSRPAMTTVSRALRHVGRCVHVCFVIFGGLSGGIDVWCMLLRHRTVRRGCSHASWPRWCVRACVSCVVIIVTPCRPSAGCRGGGNTGGGGVERSCERWRRRHSRRRRRRRWWCACASPGSGWRANIEAHKVQD
jgi:hypothetical protein